MNEPLPRPRKIPLGPARRPRRSTAGAWAAALLVGGLGCVGSVGGEKTGGGASPTNNSAPGNGSEPGGGTPAPGTANPTTQTPAPGSVNAGVAPMRRLTIEQYRNTVRDLLGLKPDAMAAVAKLALPGDDKVDDRFTSNGTSALKGIDLDRYADAAAELAKQAVTNLGSLVPCDGKAMGDAACGKRFIETFGRRGYRRPLRADEVARLEKVFAAGGSFTEGIELVITALLQSPKFLYLVEPVPVAAAGKVVAVDAYALAARLSYFLLGSMPDEALLDAAEKGRLATAEGLAGEAKRLLGDERFRENVGSFHRQWLLLHEISGAAKDPKLFPGFTPELRAALAEESRRFVEHVVSNEEGKIETLLSAPFSVLGGPLYDYYGVPKSAGDGWQKAALDPTQRAGILTHGSLLAAQAHADKTSFILRGKLVREAIFCTPIPPPPPNIVNDEVKVPATATAKERAAAHRDKPECATCHALFDPLGFAFENYDAAGRYRKTEAGGQAIDASVDVTNTEKLNGPVKDAIELAKKLGTADEVKDCVARQWLRFALGREDSPDDANSLKTTRESFRSSGKLGDLVAALARSDSFRFQRVPE